MCGVNLREGPGVGTVEWNMKLKAGSFLIVDVRWTKICSVDVRERPRVGEAREWNVRHKPTSGTFLYLEVSWTKICTWGKTLGWRVGQGVKYETWVRGGGNQESDTCTRLRLSMRGRPRGGEKLGSKTFYWFGLTNSRGKPKCVVQMWRGKWPGEGGGTREWNMIWDFRILEVLCSVTVETHSTVQSLK